ncbi:hypothetical protein [Aliikangiella coralliicola]|uniref:hypothetical protein n=1 Tax=Aliikangiella coralliicola TaxID=2592383 RepID=UPI00143D54E8|nr:hypothetical protein [Aliikangiella coralliicola]
MRSQSIISIALDTLTKKSELTVFMNWSSNSWWLAKYLLPSSVITNQSIKN